MTYRIFQVLGVFAFVVVVIYIVGAIFASSAKPATCFEDGSCRAEVSLARWAHFCRQLNVEEGGTCYVGVVSNTRYWEFDPEPGR